MPLNGNDIRIQKNLIRENLKQLRNCLTIAEKQRLDTKIANRFLNLWQYRESGLILAYVSNSIEVDTKFIIEQALIQGKRVAVPKCVVGTRKLEYYLIDSLEALEKGSFGILEPCESKCEKLLNYSGGLVIVPALSFDKNGFRLGFGKGYYDRFLSNSELKTVGICYDCCLMDDLPKGKYDRNVNMVITESKILYLA